MQSNPMLVTGGLRHRDVYMCHCNDAIIYFISERQDIQVRLAGGAAPNEGRLEIYQVGKWGAFCDADFTENEARTICRHLGFQ